LLRNLLGHREPAGAVLHLAVHDQELGQPDQPLLPGKVWLPLHKPLPGRRVQPLLQRSVLLAQGWTVHYHRQVLNVVVVPNLAHTCIDHVHHGLHYLAAAFHQD